MLLRDERIRKVGYDYQAAPTTLVDTCNLCEGATFAVLAHTDRYGFRVETHACLSCGLVFLNPRMTEQACLHFYTEVYRPLVSAYHGRQIDAESIEEEQMEYAQDLGSWLAPFLEGVLNGSLLDMGGSTGVVADIVASHFGLDATVCDPSPEEVARAQARGLRSVVATAETFEPEEKFDVVLLCQTIDHLLDIKSVLGKLRDLVRPGGVFFVDIVDFRAAYLRGSGIEAAVKVDHPYYLTESTVELYLRQAGFHLLRKIYSADGLHIGYVCTDGPASEAAPLPGDEVTRMLQEIRWLQNAPPPR